MTVAAVTGETPPPSFPISGDSGIDTDIFDTVSGGDFPYIQFLSMTDDAMIESVQAMQTDVSTLNENVSELNANFTLLIAVVVILIVWKLIAVSNKLFSWLF